MPSALLVTSAFHMPRAVGVFRKAGVEVLAWPVDYRALPPSQALFSIDFGERFEIMETAVKEWVGLFSYWYLERSEKFFPAP